MYLKGEATIIKNDYGWHELIMEYTAMLLAHAQEMLPDHLQHLAEDAVNESFMNLFRHTTNHNGNIEIEHPGAYLRTVLENVVADYKANMQNWSGMNVPLEEQHEYIESTELRPDELLLEQEEDCEQKTQLAKLIDLLPTQQRRAVELRILCNASYEDIAATMNISPVNARNHVSLGKMKLSELRRRLREKEGAPNEQCSKRTGRV